MYRVEPLRMGICNHESLSDIRSLATTRGGGHMVIMRLAICSLADPSPRPCFRRHQQSSAHWQGRNTRSCGSQRDIKKLKWGYTTPQIYCFSAAIRDGGGRRKHSGNCMSGWPAVNILLALNGTSENSAFSHRNVVSFVIRYSMIWLLCFSCCSASRPTPSKGNLVRSVLVRSGLLELCPVSPDFE